MLEEWEETVADYPDFAFMQTDVNGDLVVDRVIGDTLGNVVAYLGLGDGQYAKEPIEIYANEGAAGIARVGVGDINGDGLEDIVVGRPDGSVLLLKASALQSQSVSFERVREVTIDEALGPDVYWQIGDGWTCEQIGCDAKAVCRIEDGGSDCVTARFEGPGTVTFRWGCEGGNDSSVYKCSSDGLPELSKVGSFAPEVGTRVLIGDGSHFVTWRLSGNGKAILRDVKFTPDEEQSQRVGKTGTSYADIRRFAKSLWWQNGGDYSLTDASIAANGRPVWENCIAGLDCDDPEARFVADIAFDEEGRPFVVWHPALNDTKDIRGVRCGVRTYRVFGKKTLDAQEEWTYVPEGGDGTYNFFSVTVEMP